MSDDARRIVGSWRTDPSDAWSLRAFGEVSMRFSADGKLEYSVHGDGKLQTMYLTFRVDGDWLVTNQPSAPREELVRFTFLDDDRLCLINPAPAPPTRYIRV